MAKIAIPRLELAAGILGNSGRTATTEAANASQRTHGHSAPAEIHGVETRTPKRTSSPFRRKAAASAVMGRLDQLSWADFTAPWETDVKAGLYWMQAALNLPLAPGKRMRSRG